MTDNLPESTRPGTGVVRVAGRDYYYKTVKNCKTCRSPHRDFIENSIMKAMTYTSIADQLQDMDEGDLGHPTAPQISNHVQRNHMPIVAAAERALIEQRQRDLGRDLDARVGSLVDYASANQIVIQRGMARLVDGEITPSMGDLLAAIRNQHTIEQSVGDGLDLEAYQGALFAFMEIARDFVPPDRQQEYGRALANHPLLRAMMNKTAVDAEIVEDSS